MDAIETCSVCGTALPGGPLEGTCPACLIDASLADFEEDGMPDVPRAREFPWKFGRHLITEEIARGGVGVVFRARDEGLQRDVAIKFLHGGALASREAVRRFYTEAAAAARLQHPHVLPIFEVGGSDDGQPFLVMPFMEGGSLAGRLRDKAPMPLEDAARLIRDVACAVHHAHHHGILHRDLKPGNILFDSEDTPYVADFGLARVLDDETSITLSDAVLGTPAYMSPEQAGGVVAELTVASDIHALGAVLYELLAGRPPFAGSSVAEVLRKVREEPVTSPFKGSRRASSREADIDTICLKCLEKEPSRRYPTAQALADDLDRFIKHEPILAHPVGVAGKAWRWCRRRPVLAGLTAALALSLVAGLAGTVWQLGNARANAAESRRHLAQLHVLTGVELLQKGDLFRSLLWFAEALDLDPRSAEKTAIARVRIASIIDQAPKLVSTITHDGEPVGGAAFHPVDDRLATVGRDRGLRVWEIPDGTLIYATQPLPEMPSMVAFDPTGQRILVTSSETGQAVMLSAVDGTELSGPVPHRTGGARNFPIRPRFDASGDRLLTQTASGVLQVWDVQSGEPVGHAYDVKSPILAANFADDHETIVIASDKGKVSAWNWKAGTPAEVSTDIASVLARPVVTPGGRHKVIILPDTRIRIVDSETGEAVTPPILHDHAAGSPQFSATGRYLFTMHPAHAVHVWDLELPAAPPVLLRPRQDPFIAEAAQDGLMSLSLDPGNPIRIRAVTEAVDVSLHPSSLEPTPLQAWFDDTGRFVILETARSHAQVWDASTGLPVTPMFRSRYAERELQYRTVELPELPPASDASGAELQALAELLAGSRLDGAGGWRPLNLIEIASRWNQFQTGGVASNTGTLK